MPTKISIGEKSNPPIEGITFLIGAMIGSVSCQINLNNGWGFVLPENIMTNDIIMDAIIA